MIQFNIEYDPPLKNINNKYSGLIDVRMIDPNSRSLFIDKIKSIKFGYVYTKIKNYEIEVCEISPYNERYVYIIFHVINDTLELITSDLVFNILTKELFYAETLILVKQYNND